MMQPLIKVENLKTYYSTEKGDVKAVDGVSFQIAKGEVFGLAGESGCGKTTISLSIMRLLPPNCRVVQGRVLFKGENLLKFNEQFLNKNYRWKKMAIIFQGAMNALNPVFNIGDQISEAILQHEKVTKKEALERAQQLLAMVRIDPARIKSYPHELSGGMKQRCMIAMALACNPEFLIADEPTTAADVIVQDQIFKLMKQLQKKLGLSMMLVTHDLSVIAEICNNVAIMYAGKIVEYSNTTTIFNNPLHPYTQGLLKAFPSVLEEKKRLVSIPGAPPNLLNPPEGCRFHIRCPVAEKLCSEKEPEFLEVEPNHYVACHNIKECEKWRDQY
jgi:peptide/nickel transport system ATP-binding protein